MSPRRALAAASLLCLAVTAILLVRDRLDSAAQPAMHEIALSNGQKTTGVVMRLRPTSYLLQGSDRCVVFSEDEVESVDGRGIAGPRLPVADQVPLEFETLERILPSGQIEGRYHFRMRNSGSTVLTELNWGIAAHEIGMLDNYRVIDEYGMELSMHVEDDPSIKGKRVFVRFLRPALPGDEVRITVIGQEQTAVRSGDDWIYRVEGAYPEKRLVTRSILLPKGARIVSVTPDASYKRDLPDGPLVVWRRYFVAGERIPWEIRYYL